MNDDSPLTLILVTGLPASGKTVLSQKIAEAIQLPLISKDGIKEVLLDNLGWSDIQWSMKLGRTTYDLVFYFIERQLKGGSSLIVESPFHPEFHNERLQELQKLYHFQCVQILCYANGKVLLERYKHRSQSIERHPGQDKAEDIAGFEAKMLKEKDRTLELKGPIIEVDTTDFVQIDEEGIFKQLRELLGPKGLTSHRHVT
ncbi:MAG TPA: AAA family ATPase [Candidatus Saccharimonadales bacterium]|nr:AAA family ATPase [Candidatus Saccharimonadales bacterium]